MYYTRAAGYRVTVYDETSSVYLLNAITQDADAWAPLLPLRKGHKYAIMPFSFTLYFIPIK